MVNGDRASAGAHPPVVATLPNLPPNDHINAQDDEGSDHDASSDEDQPIYAEEEHLDPILEDPEEGKVQEPGPIAPPPVLDWQPINIARARQNRGSVNGAVREYLPKFHVNEIGPKNINFDVTKTPFDFFSLFITSAMFSIFVAATNAYGAVKYSTSWEDVTVRDLYKVLALLLYMGVNKLPDQEMYWGSDPLFRYDWIRKMMSRARFQQIWSSFHSRDITKLTAEEKNNMKRSDGFYQVSGFLRLLAVNFQHFFTCGRMMDIDEMCIFFKGRHRCRCYNPNKPNKWHLKAFCLNDASSGYLHTFYMYQGSSEIRPDGMSATVYPVWKLLQGDFYDNKGYILCTDNWYTSQDVVNICQSRGIEFVGTIKAGRKNMPKNGFFPKTGALKRNRGDMQCLHHPVLNSYLTAWQDNKPVHLLSTFPPKKERCFRNSLDDNGRYQRISVDRPSVVKVYNQAMGGTDLCDQRTSYYCYEHSSVQWPHRIFTHFFMVTCVNAHILYNWNLSASKKLSFLKFVIALIKELVAKAMEDHEDCAEIQEEIDWTTLTGKKRRREETWKTFSGRLNKSKNHTPLCISSKDKDNRQMCPVCKKKSSLKCKECDCFLHCDEKTVERVVGTNFTIFQILPEPTCRGSFFTYLISTLR